MSYARGCWYMVDDGEKLVITLNDGVDVTQLKFSEYQVANRTAHCIREVVAAYHRKVTERERLDLYICLLQFVSDRMIEKEKECGHT